MMMCLGIYLQKLQTDLYLARGGVGGRGTSIQIYVPPARAWVYHNSGLKLKY